MEKLLKFVETLRKFNAEYSLEHTSPGGVTVKVWTPTAYWEVAFEIDGEIGVEKFVSDGEILSEDAIQLIVDDLK